MGGHPTPGPIISTIRSNRRPWPLPSGCCSRPGSPWDAPPPSARDPGTSTTWSATPRTSSRPPAALLVLQGGGTDVDENFVRMGARSGGGDFVVIRASGTDAYNPYILELCALRLGGDLRLQEPQGLLPAVRDRAGSATPRRCSSPAATSRDYVKFWKDTPMEDAINYLANVKPVPIGGTSAGMAIMSEFLYSAMSNSSLTSEEGLAEPVPQGPDPRPRLPGPGQAGRHHHRPAPHGARPHGPDRGVPGPPRPRRLDDQGRAIAADRETALHVDPVDGTAEVFATPPHPTPYVYFLRTPGPPEVCSPGTPLTSERLGVSDRPRRHVRPRAWAGHGGIAYTLSAEAGVLTSSNGGIY